MLSSSSQDGRRLAAVLPSLLNSVGKSAPNATELMHLPQVRVAVLVVVDGLGWANLAQRKAHARFLASSDRERIETVRPSTTGAALTTILTGTLPSQHGLVGYRIRDTDTGRLRSTLTDWDGIADAKTWQRSPSMLQIAADAGLNPVAIGRPAHAQSGLTQSVLSRARYIGGTSIADRFAAAESEIARNTSQLIYVYIDELDRAGHTEGWQSDAWLRQLEEVDAQLRAFDASLPQDVGVLLTADHGMIDVAAHKQVLMDEQLGLLDGVAQIGGEPRCRYLYLADPSEVNVQALLCTWRESEGHRATIFSRDEAIAAGMFGDTDMDAQIASRVGDIVVLAKTAVTYYTSTAADAKSRLMVGQHGSISDDELGVPIVRLGAFSGATRGWS